MDKKKLSLFCTMLLMVVALCFGAQDIVVYWYSQAPHATSLTDSDIMLIERPSPHTNLWFNLAQLKAYVGAGVPAFGPSITTFVNNRNAVEIGSTVSSTTLTWTLGGTAPTVQTVDQGIGIVTVGTLTATDSTSYTANRTYTLTVSNPSGSDSATTSVTFESKRYWGPSATTPLTDNDIKNLSQEFASSFVGFDHNVTCANEYIYIAFPVSFGVPQVYVDGFHNTAWTITSGPFVNASGASVNYYVYRSNNLQTGGPFRIQLVP